MLCIAIRRVVLLSWRFVVAFGIVEDVEFTFVAIRRSCINSVLFGSIYFTGCLPPLCSV